MNAERNAAGHHEVARAEHEDPGREIDGVGAVDVVSELRRPLLLVLFPREYIVAPQQNFGMPTPGSLTIVRPSALTFPVPATRAAGLSPAPRAQSEDRAAGRAGRLRPATVGHTHAGQFFPWTFVIHLVHGPHAAGLSRRARLWVYVNAGTGTWGPPVRLGTRPELTLLRLVAAR